MLGGVCVECGSAKDLEFDHKDPTTKIGTIARMSSSSEEIFWAEISKCQLLCQKCHGEKTIKENGWETTKGVHGTLSNYKNYGCRCAPCKKAASEYNREYKKSRKQHKAP